MVTQLEYKQRIASTKSLQKIFNAQELIAASRIAKARRFAENAKPFSSAIVAAISSVAAHANVSHPLLTSRKVKRTAILAIAADRGMSGAYTAQILREVSGLKYQLEQQGKEVVMYISGRRAISYYHFRGENIKASWEGGSDAPGPEIADSIAKRIVSDYLLLDTTKRIDEVMVVYTQFTNMVKQDVKIIRMLPLTIDKEEGTNKEVPPLYHFEPSVSSVLDALLPRYFRSRLNECLLDAAASETASRQRAMHTATENAEDLITLLTTKSNQARQGKITSELTEIVASADALNEEN